MQVRDWRAVLAAVMCLTIAGPLQTTVALAREPAEAQKDLQARLRAAEAWLGVYLEQEAVPAAAVAVVHDQKILWEKGFGHADAEKKIPVSSDTRFSICSISKLFTGMAVMQLRDAGVIELDRPVSAYLPWYDEGEKEEEPATIRSILSHVSGLPREAGHPYWATREFPDLESVKGQTETLSAQSMPFEYFQYSNLAMVLLGEVVEAVSGVSYETYIQSRLIDPIGLKNTSPHWPRELYGREFAAGFGPRAGDGTRKPFAYYEIGALAPAAGFSSSAADLARIASWQFRVLEGVEPDILSASALREMQRIHWASPDRPEESWGLGFRVFQHGGETLVGHDGGCPGFNSTFILRPQDRIAIIMLVDVNDVDPGPLALSLYDFIAPLIREAYPRPAAPAPARALDLSAYEGVYGRADYHNHIYVFPEKGELATAALYEDAAGARLERYRHIEGTTFRRIRHDGSLAETLIFELDRSGEPVRLWRHDQFMERVTNP